MLNLKKELNPKKILILGLGKEGVDTLMFLRKLFPGKILGVGDKDKNSKFKIKNLKLLRKVTWYLGRDYLKPLEQYDLIIKSPGIPVNNQALKQAFREGKITSQTELFLRHCPGKIIGITGTKGKGTTSSLIYKILKQGGKKVYLVGNIGKPALSLLFKAKPKDIFVYEMSSHQLMNLRTSPNIAVFLNIYPAHLDYYRDFQEYFQAKKNIFLHQKSNDVLIYNKDDQLLKEAVKKAKSKKISFSLKSQSGDYRLRQDLVVYHGKKMFHTANYRLKGEFNLVNTMAAIIVGRILNVPLAKITNAVKNFKGMPYRLEFVGKYSGVDFYNDSLATIPQATIAAIEALGDRIGAIILGGFESGLDYSKLARVIAQRKIKNLILFPTTGGKIAKAVKKYFRFNKSKKAINYFFVNDMKEAIKLSLENTEKGDICLLSPASPSFGVFKNYKERGDLFKKYIKVYGKKN
ncbi:MAG: UDP-N-acetylmuramoylalanine--D-glutamate ligase [Candidatus Wildermuthbacteria bacterium RIFCSPLOWO2_12_FULL_40_9]|uniref:UDP-N-acetylmuramoylalanine--D-glutamate ligase n=1 Tax=Candidatus Wildermuthbacteria bacterium RIFCSPLOWO2_12_FULL_40_9 TaxID=1802467 RepID=A0A1G2RVM4_9BACT|nr:MAG: UDP-N-acetylmuramoylalanine--D-glutamate ligase [Candidatus Wildermuthbacteria bacterium RIFCSPLOWO2_12_FULL_40_9]